MNQQGVVIEIMDSQAKVKVNPTAQCQGCESKGFCHPLKEQKEIETLALNPINAEIGDEVCIELSSPSLLKISLVLYLIPLTGFFMGILTARMLPPPGFFNHELFYFLSGTLGLLLSIPLIRKLGGKISADPSHLPRIIQIVKKKNGLNR